MNKEKDARTKGNTYERTRLTKIEDLWTKDNAYEQRTTLRTRLMNKEQHLRTRVMNKEQHLKNTSHEQRTTLKEHESWTKNNI